MRFYCDNKAAIRFRELTIQFKMTEASTSRLTDTSERKSRRLSFRNLGIRR